VSTESEEEEARTLLTLLGDEYVQSILAATSEEAKSAKELSAELDTARSTVYRRAEEMLDHSLIVEETRIRDDGSHHSVYKANVDHLDVELTDGEFAVRVETRETPADRFTEVWDDIRDV
jgi:methylthioribose-1-phosphate isomerase